MPYENCDSCKKCLPCPVTSGDKNEGAYAIAQDEGDIWYCSSCFYCEDICPEFSPRQYAIDKRRLSEQQSDRTRTPLGKIKTSGHLFEMTSDIDELRMESGLPVLPKPNIGELNILFDLLTVEKTHTREENVPIISQERESLSEKTTKVALFLGCLIPYRVREYELSAREVIEKLDVKYLDLPFSCCGSVMTESHSEDLWLTIGAYNLAIAEENGINTILTLCGGCCGNLRRVKNVLIDDERKLKKINNFLTKINKKFTGNVAVKHFSEFLHEVKIKQKLITKIKEERTKKLNKLQVGIQVPCQVIRPKEHSPMSDLKVKLLKDILQPTKINFVKYQYETLCCGSSLLQYGEKLAFKIAKKRIDALKKRNADAIIMGCGNCSMNYKIHQKSYSHKKLPAFFFTEIINYALGGENNDLTELLKKKVEGA